MYLTQKILFSRRNKLEMQTLTLIFIILQKKKKVYKLIKYFFLPKATHTLTLMWITFKNLHNVTPIQTAK